MGELIGYDELPRRLTKCTEQSGKGQDDNNKDVRVLAVKGRKVTTTTAGAKPVVRKLLTVSTRGPTECMGQSGSKQVDNNEEVRVPAFKGRKVAITTVSAKPKGGKLLTASTKVALEKNG